ncbi:GFA family protein [Congregibacter brevis]|uniref:GFA family protein n=1 Tax=Congregibacter brevis TaxID=3081201 RepID=A0ABZ0IJ78_9GAMM|nr:GFA family protein [Congregibacter sp. IMCC45268]
MTGPEKPPLAITGACNCCAVRFEINTDVSDIYVCHCSICRRSTGSNGIAVIVVDNTAFRWTAGEDSIATWKKPDVDWQTWFCRHCGSRLPGANDAERTFVPAGLLLEGSESLAVKHHIFVDSKADWDEIGDDGCQHPEAFGS